MPPRMAPTLTHALFIRDALLPAATNPRVPGAYALKACPIARGPGEKRVKTTTQSAGAVGLAVERRAYVLQIKGAPHVPALPPNGYGDESGYRYLVMQRMGDNLKDRAEAVGGAFTPGAVALVGQALVRVAPFSACSLVLYGEIYSFDVHIARGSDAVPCDGLQRLTVMFV